MSPLSILSKSVYSPIQNFSIEPLVQMLEDEGIYEKTSASKTVSEISATLVHMDRLLNLIEAESLDICESSQEEAHKMQEQQE